MASISIEDWLNTYPDPVSVSSRTSREDAIQLLQNSDEAVILDIRGDRSPAYISRSVHVPATDVDGYEQVKPKILDVVFASYPKTKLIIVHCNSSAKRASKIGGWLDDYLKENGGDFKVTILDEGIKGWLAAGAPYDSLLVSV